MILRPPDLGDEHEFRAAHAVLASEGFDFGLGLDDLAWTDYLRRRAEIEAGVNLGALVPESFRVADVDGVIVGRTSVRHRLNAALETYGGHIGYCVLPAQRGRGHAKEILRQSLVLARSAGVMRALLTCDETNLASRRVIESAGGVHERTDGGTRRYWVETC
jgi:predicted acetyltransferase